MGWSSGTDIFDKVVEDILNKESREQILETLITALEDHDWDGPEQSSHWDNPNVRRVFKHLHPDWDWDEIESE